MIQAPVSPHDSDPTLPKCEFDRPYCYILTNYGCHSWLNVLLKCPWTPRQMILPNLRELQNYSKVFWLKIRLSNFMFVTESLLIRCWTSWKVFATLKFANTPFFSFAILSVWWWTFQPQLPTSRRMKTMVLLYLLGYWIWPPIYDEPRRVPAVKHTWIPSSRSS